MTAALLELASSAGLEADKTALQPASVPFVGRYSLPASSPGSSWSQRRLEATIPLRRQAIVEEARVVIDADASRAAVTAAFVAGRCPVERVLAGVEAQGRATSAFLLGVTEYNRAITQYAAMTLPMNTEAERFVAALMVE